MDRNIALFGNVMDIVINVFFFFWIEENFSNFTAKSEVFSFANNEHEGITRRRLFYARKNDN